MATLGVQSITTTGLAANYANATATTGDRFLPADGTFLHVKNANAGPVSVLLDTPAQIDGLDVAQRTISIPTGTDRFIAVPDSLYRASDGLATVTCTPNTSVTLAVIHI